MVDWSKGYNFHDKNEKDKAQKLIFQDVTPLDWFKKDLMNFQCSAAG